MFQDILLEQDAQYSMDQTMTLSCLTKMAHFENRYMSGREIYRGKKQQNSPPIIIKTKK